jgi:hypothetical protein
MPGDREPAKGFRQLAWFIGFYAVSLVLFAALVYGLRAIIPR